MTCRAFEGVFWTLLDVFKLIVGGEGGRLWLKKNVYKNQASKQTAASVSVPPKCLDVNACLGSPSGLMRALNYQLVRDSAVHLD